jgi:hypothetical protein
MTQIKVRTSGAHKHHTLHRKGSNACGCATKQNTGPDIEITRCPCGCAYLTEILLVITPFTCYDCKRAVHVAQPKKS